MNHQKGERKIVIIIIIIIKPPGTLRKGTKKNTQTRIEPISLIYADKDLNMLGILNVIIERLKGVLNTEDGTTNQLDAIRPVRYHSGQVWLWTSHCVGKQTGKSSRVYICS